MKLLIEFDVDGDIIEVPSEVIANKERYRKQFLDWLYHPKVKHSYRKTVRDRNGREFTGLCYRGEAFVEWLNKKLPPSEAATLVQSQVCIADFPDLPRIFF